MSDKGLYFKYENTKLDMKDVEVFSYGVIKDSSDGVITAMIFVSYGGVFELHNNFMFKEEVLETMTEIGEEEFERELQFFKTSLMLSLEERKGALPQ